MLIDYIFLDPKAAAVYLGFTAKELRVHFKESPIQLSQLAKVQTQWIGDDTSLICLKTPEKGGFSLALRVAALPAVLKPEILDEAINYLTLAPFMISVIDILHFLNEHQLSREKSIFEVARSLSDQKFFQLYKVDKTSKNYQSLLAQHNNPPILTEAQHKHGCRS
jgi:hypothetical protein